MKIFKAILSAELYIFSAISYAISFFSLAPAILVCMYGIVIVAGYVKDMSNGYNTTPSHVFALLVIACTIIFALLLVLIFFFVATLALSGAIYLTIDLIKSRKRRSKNDNFEALTQAENEGIKSDLASE